MEPKPAHELLGGLRIERPLSTGPGESFLAADALRRGSARWVLKLVRGREGSPLSERLRPDAAALASLAHPALAVPSGYGADPAAGRAWVLRPFVPGSELSLAARGRTVRDLLPWLASAAEAVGVLHRAGFLHGNVKASNLLVTRKALVSGAGSETKVVLCDPAWWPAEPGARTLRADLRALGETFHELLTGRRSVSGDGRPPLRPSRLNPDVSLDLERLLTKLVDPDPERGYSDASALVEDLRLLCGSRAPARLPPPDVFLDRTEEIDRALSCLRAAARSISGGRRPRPLAVGGEAGTGKTAFLHRLALEAQLLGYRTIPVRCWPEPAAPLGPVAALVEALGGATAAGRAWRREARRLLGGHGPPGTAGGTVRAVLADGARGAAGPAGSADPRGRQRLVRAVLDLLARAPEAERHAILIDDIHLADSVTVDVLAGLVRDLSEAASPAGGEDLRRSEDRGGDDGARGGGLPGLIATYRTESPFRAAVRPLLDALPPGPDGAGTIELRSLPDEAVSMWLDLAGWPEGPERDEAAGRLRGNPFAVREAIRARRSGSAAGTPPGSDLPSLHRVYLASLPPESRRALELVALLGRPCSPDLAADVLGIPAARLRAALSALYHDGALVEEGGLSSFRHGSFRSWVEESIDPAAAKALHGDVAKAIEARSPDLVEEIAHHWLRSDRPEKGAAPAVAAARRLVRNHEDRKALALYRASLERLPPSDAGIRRAVAEETAEACSRTGEHGTAIEILKGLVESAPDSREAGRLHGRLGVFAHRSGDAGGATFHLEKALALLEDAAGEAALRARLSAISELAELANTRGDYAKAETLCRESLDLLASAAGASADVEVRREEMVILETLAHLRLRRFRYDEARDLFERSLAVGEALGAAPEKALILNNLGTLHVQENRFHQAIECYEKAARLSMRLGDDQSLAAIEANLAVLRARTGEPEAADEAIERARHHDARSRSPRTRFLVLHSAGLVDLLLGRYAAAVESLNAAILAGEDLNDRHIVAFDLVYLGECLLFRGELKAARSALDRASGSGPRVPAPVPSMVAARSALIAALRGDAAEARASIDASRTEGGPGVPYVDAWNRVFTGWARRLLGLHDEAAADLEAAAAFFAEVKVPAGEILAQLECALADAGRGRPADAERRLRRVRSRFSCGVGVLRNPMLSARLVAYQALLLLAKDPPDTDEAQSLVLEAESHLIGRRLRDVERLAADLRERLRRAGAASRRAPTEAPRLLGAGGAAGAPGAPRAPGAAPEGPRGGEDPGLLGALRGGLEEALRAVEDVAIEGSDDRSNRARDRLREAIQRIRDAQRAAERRGPEAARSLRASEILGRSAATRRTVDLVLQVAPSGLPVLITGETGAGKEVVARAVHGESPRRDAPLVSVNCAALPEPLLEAQLFGYVKGAFTGAEEDRPGLLAAARGGSFLLDEIGDLPIELQAKLLRVLDRGAVRPVGGQEEVPVDVRWVFATNRDLRALVREGRFRQDLFYRLGAFEIPVPPLRDRPEDVPILAEHFRAAAAGPEGAPAIDEAAYRALAAYPWPGNVRELQNVVTRLVLTSAETIGEGDVRAVLGSTPIEGVLPASFLRSRPLDRLLAEVERAYLIQLHRDLGGDLAAMASRLGITVRALYDRFKRVGIRRRDLDR